MFEAVLFRRRREVSIKIRKPMRCRLDIEDGCKVRLKFHPKTYAQLYSYASKMGLSKMRRLLRAYVRAAKQVHARIHQQSSLSLRRPWDRWGDVSEVPDFYMDTLCGWKLYEHMWNIQGRCWI